ncbi:glutathione S-transferase, C-terminal-like protein [Nitzschia inconspicua]|uniref:Glutathione S-transferase, C-terminal-like protein n=1 Tax=Nitzschia inconspicua TaxID=303405 RepID=A0A9K3M5F9_9STRA|nr:glutathione S-transferase, C-terminal-like protein [Nitzschia inconspicua]
MVARTALDEMGDDGSFKRKDAAWRNWISREEDAKFKPEASRYHLFVAYACPWATRTLMTRAVKGLEDVIDVTVVMPVWKKTKPEDPDDKHTGWVFADPNGEPYRNTIGLGGPFQPSLPGNEPDPFYNSYSVRELYERAGDTDGKYTVPVLWDKKTNTIVSNESADIIKMLNREFNAFAKNPDLELEPEDLRETMEEVDSWIYPNINNGVYRCGFAKSQEAYDKAIEDLTEAFDRLENILSERRYIAGDKFTLSDIRLFVTLVRYDEVYHVYFKTNTRSIIETPVLLNYVREIYQMPGVKETVNMEQIKMHYYCSHPDLNKFSVIPKGNNFEGLLKMPHNRDQIMMLSQKSLDGSWSMREEKKDSQ